MCNSTNFTQHIWKILTISLFTFKSLGQNHTVIDHQELGDGKVVELVTYPISWEPEGLGFKYAVKFINRFNKDTLINDLKDVQFTPCTTSNSIFFINDSIGFITASGGCYASYNQLFRTTDKGLTWQHIPSASRIDGNFYSHLNNETFYMFNASDGIIIWHVNEADQLMYSLTHDGGITWNQLTIPMEDIDEQHQDVQKILYAANGQVTLVLSSDFILESDRQNVVILQSNNFGKSFKKLK